MLVLDTSRQAFHAARKHQEAQREKTRALLQQAREREEMCLAPDGNLPVTELGARLGRPLAHTDVQKRLAKLNPNLIFIPANSNPKGIGIYIRKAGANPNDAKYRGIAYTGISFEKGYLPEFDVTHSVSEEYWDDETKTPKTRQVVDHAHPLTRGWWTLVLRLIHTGYIERSAALKAFGRLPSLDSQKWQQAFA